MSEDISQLGSGHRAYRTQVTQKQKNKEQAGGGEGLPPRGEDTVEISYRPLSTIPGLMEELDVSQEELDNYVQLAMNIPEDEDRIDELKNQLMQDGIDIEKLFDNPEFIEDIT